LCQQRDLSTIQPSKLADITVVKGDPLSDIVWLANVVVVVIGAAGFAAHIAGRTFAGRQASPTRWSQLDAVISGWLPGLNWRCSAMFLK
jgi:hypothetical protein